MRISVYSLLLFILMACHSSSTNEKEVTADLTQAKHSPTDTLSIKDIPQDWIELSEEQDKLVIIEPCDGTTAKLTLLNDKENTYQLLTVYGQMADYFIIKKVQSPSSDKIIFTGRYELAQDNTDTRIELQYDKAKQISRWTTYNGDTYNTRIFTTEERAAKYTRKAQPCTECWSEEECAEIQRKKQQENREGASITSFEGTYVTDLSKSGYWQTLVIEKVTDETFNVRITSSSKKGCNFSELGQLRNGRIEIDFSKLKPELKAIMAIKKKGNVLEVFSINDEDRFDLMCQGGASLAGDYYKDKK